jgi:hypothetical protein
MLVVALLAAALLAATLFSFSQSRPASAAGQHDVPRAGPNPSPQVTIAKPALARVEPAPRVVTATPAAFTGKALPSSAPPSAPDNVIQLGAFANEVQAARAWTALSARFPSLLALNKIVMPFPGGFRLRAATQSSGQATQVCQALKAAGENCFVAH